MFMHLTNYAINKTSAKYVPGQGDQGHKRSLGAILRIMREEGFDTDGIYE